MSGWTYEERCVLKKEYNVTPIEELAKKLGRSASAIRSQVHILRKKGWTFARVT